MPPGLVVFLVIVVFARSSLVRPGRRGGSV
jgi:hypothetical protein